MNDKISMLINQYERKGDFNYVLVTDEMFTDAEKNAGQITKRI